MLDVKFIVENPGLIKQGAAKKHVKVEVDKIVKLYEARNKKLQKAEAFRARQNEVSSNIATSKNKEKLLKEMKKIKEDIKDLEPEIAKLEKKIDELAILIPNLTLSSTPEGAGEKDNKIVKTIGEKPNFDFAVKDHAVLGKALDIIDIERGVRTSGARFYYLKNDAVLMEFALVQYVMNKLMSKGFSPIIPPTLVKEEAMFGTGFFPADRNEIYKVNPEEDNLYLIGTSEVPLNMLHATEILQYEKLPIRYCGFSTCFRREAGTYGKDTVGIFRVHQFDKIEMFSFCHPEKSEEEHELILSIEEEIMKELGFYYQVVNICAGGLGAPAAKKYDIEVWLPSEKRFRELTSCSNCTDFQARRSRIRFKNLIGGNEYVHTLNGTAVAIGRMLIAIFENYQTKDGTIRIPKVLQGYMEGKTEIKK